MASSPHTVIVDDQDSSISYQGQWSRNGSSMNYVQTSCSPRDTGAQMSFTFNGTSIALVGDIDAGGTCNATFTIDGSVEYYSSPLLSTTQHQQTLWTSPQLSDSEHTLVYTVTACKSGQNTTEATSSFLWFDYLLYNTSETPLSRTLFIDDRDERVVYSGSWIKDGGDGDFRLTRQGGTKGSSFGFVFTGSYISVNGRLENSTSLTHVSFALDGDPTITHGYPPQNFVSHNKEFFTNASLSPGEHTLTVTSLSDTPFYFDYILVRDPYAVSKDSKASFPVGGVMGFILGALGIITVICAVLFYRRRQRASRTPPKVPDKGNASAAGEIILFPPVSRPNISSTPSTQSVTGLLASPTPFSSSAALSSPTAASFADDTFSHHEPLQIEVDYPLPADDWGNLPPEYSTTASSGLNIGCIPSSPGHNSGYSESSSTQFPPSRSHTLSSIHHRHNSGTFDTTAEEHVHPNDSRFAQTSRNHSPLVPRRALPSTPPGSPLRPHISSNTEDQLYLRKMKALERDGYNPSLPSSHSRGPGYEAPLSPLRRRQTGDDASTSPRSHLSVGHSSRPSTSPSPHESGVASTIPHSPRLHTINPDDDNALRVPELKGKQRMLDFSEGSSSRITPIMHVDSGIRLTPQTGRSPATDAPLIPQHSTASSRPSTASGPSYPPSRPDSASVYSRPGTASTFAPSRPNTATSTQQPLASPSDHTRVEDSEPLELPPMYTPN